jgi:hypothetical protein
MLSLHDALLTPKYQSMFAKPVGVIEFSPPILLLESSQNGDFIMPS